jgi:hypothetical protein
MSNYVKATNFAVKDTLSTGDANKIVRGTEIDTEFTAIASAIASKSDSNSPTFTGTPLAPTPASGTNNTQIATTAFVNTVVSGGIPSGVIVMWSGSIASIPSGWVLCDGTNSTPNLRDRFVIGAGSSYAVGGTGGSKDAVVVAHTHSGSTSTASLSGTVTGISETFNVHGTASGSFSKLTGYNNPLTTIDNDNGNTGGFSFDGSHSHSFTTNSAGSSGTNANLPPYYALAYIMKV